MILASQNLTLHNIRHMVATLLSLPYLQYPISHLHIMPINMDFNYRNLERRSSLCIIHMFNLLIHQATHLVVLGLVLYQDLVSIVHLVYMFESLICNGS